MRCRTCSIDGPPVSKIGFGGYQEGVETGSGITRNTCFFRAWHFMLGQADALARTM